MNPDLLKALDSAVTTFVANADQQATNLLGVEQAQSDVTASQAKLASAQALVKSNATALQSGLDAINVAAAALGLTVNVPPPAAVTTTTTTDPNVTTTVDPNTTPTTLPPS